MTKEAVIEETVANYWNVRDEFKNLPLSKLQSICAEDALPFAVCAINVTGDLNLGVMMRTASLAGAERFIIYGKHSYDRRTTVGAHNYIDVWKAGSIDRGGSLEVDYSEFMPMLTAFRYVPVFIETSAKPIYDFDPYRLRQDTGGMKPCLVFGNEGLGIDPRLLKDALHVYSIPQRGVLRSYNVSSAAAIAINYVSHEIERRLSNNASFI